MKCRIIGILCALSLAGCSSLSALPLAPASLADKTTLDEKLAYGFEATYKLWRTTIQTGVDTGFIKGERAARVAVCDNKIYATLKLERLAYDSANSQSYVSAYLTGMKLITQGALVIKGGASC